MNEDGTMTIKELASGNPTPAESIAYGQNLFKKWTSNINWRNILIWFVSVAMITLIIYLICNVQYLKANPLELCKDVPGCFCGN